MKNLPKVSVIIPCYNRDHYISETIQSVLSQSYQNIELIVVDDGCTDGSRAILEGYGSKITLFEHPERVNKGQSAAINVGLNAATGEYIAILDSDDLFLPTKIEKQVLFLESNCEIGLVYCNGHSVNATGEKIGIFYGSDHVEESSPARLLMDCYFLLPNNSLVRKSLYDEVGGFDESLRSAQDHDMALRIAERTKMGYIDEVLFCYRRHKNSISHTRAKLRWMNGFIILNKASKRYPYSKHIIKKRAAVLNFRMGQCHVEDSEYLKAFIRFLKAGFLDPRRTLSVVFGRERISSHHS